MCARASSSASHYRRVKADFLFEQEEKKGAKAAESEEVKLYGILPPITKVCPSARSNNPGGWAIDSATRGQMDNSLSTLKKCRHLSLSSHSIEKISNLSGLGARTNRPLSLCFVASTELRGVAWRARSSFYPCPHGRLPSCSPLQATALRLRAAHFAA